MAAPQPRYVKKWNAQRAKRWDDKRWDKILLEPTPAGP